jgi:hypothetical protein
MEHGPFPPLRGEEPIFKGSDERTGKIKGTARASQGRAPRSYDAILALSQRAMPDMIQIQRLKKRKLFLRDEIIKIESRLLPDIIA